MTDFNQAGTSWPKPASVPRALQAALDEPQGKWAESFERDTTLRELQKF